MKTTIALLAITSGLLLGCNKSSTESTTSNESVQPSGRTAATQTNQWRQTSGPPTNPERTVRGDVPPDNTGVNVRDREGATVTSGDQGQSKEDVTLSQNIRKDLMADESLSTTANNIKIITMAGKVTLRGPVNSEQEKTDIGEKARAAAGVTDVDNQLEVKPQTNP